MKIIIKKTKDKYWDLVSETLKNESGLVTNTELRDSVAHYNATFSTYGGMFFGIPESVVEIVDISNLNN